MATPTTFERKEIKYLISYKKREELNKLLNENMKPDSFGRGTVFSIYYDTENKQLIRHSLESPIYKEKLRMRSYGVADNESDVYIELKKKYLGIVYKRRVQMKLFEAVKWLNDGSENPCETQIANEIGYFKKLFNPLIPTALISSDREAYFGKDDSDFRMTFDDNILWRDYDLSLERGAYGKQILPPMYQLMEIKVGYGMPMWLSEFLSEQRLFKCSFSKYGCAYESMLKNSMKEADKSA